VASPVHDGRSLLVWERARNPTPVPRKPLAPSATFGQVRRRAGHRMPRSISSPDHRS
jgi:hypothetical protein